MAASHIKSCLHWPAVTAKARFFHFPLLSRSIWSMYSVWLHSTAAYSKKNGTEGFNSLPVCRWFVCQTRRTANNHVRMKVIQLRPASRRLVTTNWMADRDRQVTHKSSLPPPMDTGGIEPCRSNAGHRFWSGGWLIAGEFDWLLTSDPMAATLEWSRPVYPAIRRRVITACWPTRTTRTNIPNYRVIQRTAEP